MQTICKGDIIPGTPNFVIEDVSENYVLVRNPWVVHAGNVLAFHESLREAGFRPVGGEANHIICERPVMPVSLPPSIRFEEGCVYEVRSRSGSQSMGAADVEPWCRRHGWDCPNARVRA